MKDDSILDVFANNSAQNVSSEEAAEIYNNRDNLAYPPSIYMGDYNQYKNEVENSKLEINNYIDYKGLTKSLSNSNLYSVYKDHMEELKEKERLLNQKRFDESGFWNRLSSAYSTSSLSIDKSKLQKELMDARASSDTQREKELLLEIAEKDKELSKYETESQQSFASAFGSLGASLTEFLPEVLASAGLAVASTALTPVTGGASSAGTVVGGVRAASAFSKILKFAQPVVQAGLVYNKSANIEIGGIYEELGKKYPNMDEQTKQDIATVGGRLSGSVEALGASLGFGSIATKYVYPAIAKKMVKGELKKDVAKSALFEKTFLEKLGLLAKDSLISGSEEGAEEVVQNAMNATIQEIAASGEKASYLSVLKDSIANLGRTASNLVTGNATDEDLEQLKTFFYVMSSSGLLSAGMGSIGNAISSSAGKFSAPKGQQKNFLQIASEGEQNLNKAEAYMNLKKESQINQISPDAYKENSRVLVEEDVAPKNIYMDVDKALELVQQAQTDDTLALSIIDLDLDNKIKEAQQGDGKVAIEFEKADDIIFNAENDTLFQKVKNDISFDYETMSKTEADTYIQDIFNSMPELKDEVKDKQTIAGQVVDELKGNMEDEEAVANASLAKLMLSSLAEATGADEKTIIKDLDLKIQADKRRKNAAKVARNMKPTKKLLGKDKLKGVKIKKKTVDLKTVEPNDVVAGQGVDYMKEEGDNVILYEDKNGENIVVRGNEAVASANLAQGEAKADVTVVSAKDGYTFDDAEKMASAIDEDIIADTQDEKLYQLLKDSNDLAEENARLDDIYPEYKGETININGEEKTVYNSNGDRIAKSEQALRNFYNWFGDSKVVDEQGRPMVVYHGSDKIFDTFDNSKSDKIRQIGADKGYFFTTSEKVARRFIPKKEQNRDENKIIKKEFGSVKDYNEFKNKLYKDANSLKKELGDDVFFEKRNKFFEVQNKLSEPYDAQEYGLYSVYLKAENVREISGEVIGTGVDREFFMESSRQTGYDGIIIRDADTGAGIADEFIVFGSNQIKSTDNQGTFSLEDNNIYYQRAYAGSRVDYDNPSLEAMGSGEGNQAHGYGLYYTLKKAIAERYRKTFIATQDKEAIKSILEKHPLLSEKDVQIILVHGKKHAIEHYKKDVDIYHKNNKIESIAKKEQEALGKIKEIENIKEDELKLTGGQVHEVELPEMPELLDEQDLINNQSEFIRKTVRTLLNSYPDDFIVSKDINNFGGMTGQSLYKELMFIAQRQGIKSDFEQKKFASKKLLEFGIKGITYDGQQDGRCFVIFDDKDVEVVQKFYQASESTIAGYYDPKQVLIRLTEASNPTTFAHELMHFHFDMMSRAFESGKLTEFWGKQFKKLLDALGAKVVDGKITYESNEARINANERLAEQFTTYLSEGKAPAKGLEAIFAMFREMFVRAYRTIKGLNKVKLNKAVTEYFDTMLVKEDEATLLENQEHYGAVERPSGVSDSQWENYLALTKKAHSSTVSSAFGETAKIAEKRATEAYKAKFKENYEMFLDTLQDDPQFQAWDLAFTSKINPESLKGKLTEGRQINSVFLKKGGLDAEIVMAQGGFDSVNALVDFLNANKSTKKTAESMAKDQTDEWLKKEYPELEKSDVEASSRNIATIKVQLQEAMMLRGVPLDQFGLYYANLVSTAEKAFNSMRADKAANVDSLMTQLNTLTERYRIAEMKNDRNEMGKLRYRAAVLNYTLLRAYTLRAMIKRFDRHFTKYKKTTPTQAQLKKIEGSVWSIIHTALYNFKYTARKPISSESVSSRIDEYVSQNNNTFLSKDLLLSSRFFLDNNEGTPLSKVTTEDFAMLNASLRLLESVSRMTREKDIAGKKESIDDAVEQINAKLDEEGRGFWEKDDEIKNFFLGRVTMKETLLNRIFPQKIFVSFVLPFMQGLTEKAQWIEKKGEQLAKILDPIKKRKKEMYTIDGNTFSLENLLVIMLNSGNEHNRKCILKTLNESKRYGEFTEERLQRLLNESPKELRAIAQQIWDFFEENVSDFKKAQERIMGAELKIVEPTPITFSDGETLKGGYYPAGKKAIAVDKDFTDASNMNQSKTFPIFGFQKERQALVHGDLDMTIGTLETWLYQMSSMINVAEPYMNLYSLISNKDFANRFGDGGIASLQQWMMLSIKPEAVSKGIAFLDSMASVGVLGWSAIKFFVQLSGVSLAMKEVGVIRVLNEFVPLVVNPQKWFTTWNDAKGLSKYMNDRFSNPQNHLADIRRMSAIDGGKIKKGLEVANNLGMFAVAYGDCFASFATWKAQYKKSLEEGFNEKEASLMADSMVRRLQGDTSAGSRPPLIQGNARFLTKFASYFLGVNSLITSDVAYGSKANAIAVLAVAGIFAPVIEASMSYLLEWEGADDEKKRRWAKEGINSAEDLLQQKIVENVGSSTGASLLPAYGIGAALGRAAVGEKVYPAEITSLTYAYNFIKIGEDLRDYTTAKTSIEKEKAEKRLMEHSLKAVGINATRAKENINLINKLLRRE